MSRKTTPVESLTHDGETRANIPPAEMESVLDPADTAPMQAAFARRNPDLDPQLVWRGKDTADWSDLVVQAPPLFIQEQVHPKALIDDLRAERERAEDLFGHFGVTEEAREAEIEYYRHTARWSNRMILGDSLQVMASLAEREGLRGSVQCIYLDPPYGIRFNSNFQWSTTSRDVKDGKLEHLTREPEQVKAFRDTWRDGIHSYLTYLRDRLTVARDLLTESGSIFVQIGDENVHRVRALMDEVFGETAAVSMIAFTKGATGLSASDRMPARLDYILWYAHSPSSAIKYRQLYTIKNADDDPNFNWIVDKTGGKTRSAAFEKSGAPWPEGARFGQDVSLTKPGPGAKYDVAHQGRIFNSGKRWWGTTKDQLERALKSDRLVVIGNSIRHLRFLDESSLTAIGNLWDGFLGQSSPVYVVQTNTEIVQRLILMTTDPGDLVLDPTCGSGTTATVAEQWGRRWITIDTSRVALALARARVMGARYPYYLLADSPEGQAKEAELSRTTPSTAPTHGDIRHGFVYQRVPHITLKSIANNAEIDVIWERMQPAVEAARAALNESLAGHPEPLEVTTGGRKGSRIDFTATGEVEMPSGEMAPAGGFMEWEIPREAPEGWPEAARAALAAFWEARIARQREIDASIAAKAEQEYLYDKPYEDKKRVRVAGPFTVESLSPHRTAAVDEDGELIDSVHAAEGNGARAQEAENFTAAVLENLRRAGVHQPDRGDRIEFTALEPWPGDWVHADGRYLEGETERRAAIFIGPEYGTVQRSDLVAAAREAAEAGFDVLVACAFNYDAHAGELRKIGAVPVLKARMNPDLHMAGELKAGGGNLFVVFGEPDVELIEEGDRLRVKIHGVDVFKPQTGAVES
jgi:adenine-specific DNA-methyltransferase